MSLIIVGACHQDKDEIWHMCQVSNVLTTSPHKLSHHLTSHPHPPLPHLKD